VEILFDRPSSKIHVIDNFISQEECDAMTLAAEPRLHQATVADGKGGSHFSEHRKAMQAGIRVHWEKERHGDKIAQLSRRVYDYANYALDLGIEEHGQEDLMSIQYFGRGKNDTAPDRYTPHCDGDCDGLDHKVGTRMATVVMYCSIPEFGGHTNFRNANVHVKPKRGSAVFFAYMDPETKVMDNGFTEHSGCPVYEGEKKIDRYLPIANIARIMKNTLPENAKIAKDSKETVQECVSEFISFITSEASDKCLQEKRKTINGDDLLWAMSTLGFDKYVEPLKLYLNKYREAVRGDKPEKHGGGRAPHMEGGVPPS
ncbi:MAG: hypothetical protein SGBAC_010827, partial [Bacillariaceae sp.]